MIKRKAFTLIELMVVMGIMAFLLVIGAFAYATLQQSSRDTQRIAMLSSISDKINTFQKTNLRYPNSTSELIFSENSVSIGSQILNLDDFRKSSIQTTNSSTKYYYQVVTGGYVLCAKLESGKVESAGTVACPTNI